MDLIEKSIKVILRYQDRQGAYIASPNFPPYQYGWFRDGVYTAYAMGLYDHHHSAEKFYDWSVRVIEKYAEKIREAAQDPEQALAGAQDSMFHCRFTLDGDEIISGWSTHQLDGLGLWLWGVVQHCRARGLTSIPDQWQSPVDLVLDYLKAMWPYPCADCWEENDDQIHTYTLAAIAGGFMAYGEFAGEDCLSGEVGRIKEYINRQCVSSRGYYQKSCSSLEVDANLLGLVFPFDITSPTNPKFQKTLEKIEQDLLVPGGGVKRYQGDTYYGGGEWVLLTAWLGLTYLREEHEDKALKIKDWIEAQADEKGFLPEQVVENVTGQPSLHAWIEKWGQPAAPLLWSHANYLILCHNLTQER